MSGWSSLNTIRNYVEMSKAFLPGYYSNLNTFTAVVCCSTSCALDCLIPYLFLFINTCTWLQEFQTLSLYFYFSHLHPSYRPYAFTHTQIHPAISDLKDLLPTKLGPPCLSPCSLLASALRIIIDNQDHILYSGANLLNLLSTPFKVICMVSRWGTRGMLSFL